MFAPATAESGPIVTTKSPTLQRGITPDVSPTASNTSSAARQWPCSCSPTRSSNSLPCKVERRASSRRVTMRSSIEVTRSSKSRERSACAASKRSSRCTMRVRPDSGLSSENCALIWPCACSTRPTRRDSAESLLSSENSPTTDVTRSPRLRSRSPWRSFSSRTRRLSALSARSSENSPAIASLCNASAWETWPRTAAMNSFPSSGLSRARSALSSPRCLTSISSSVRRAVSTWPPITVARSPSCRSSR